MKDIQLGNKWVGDSHKPFVIAEMSGNHNHSIERAFEIIEAAAKTGVDAIKIQTYTADTITLDSDAEDFQVKDKNSLWSGERLYDLYKKAYTPWEWHKQIYDKAASLGLICFSTPFDETAVDFLEGLNNPFYKIASFENVHIPLIRKVAKTGKPVIISTGMASIADLDDAVKAIRESGNEQIILLKCTSSYPATPKNTNISTIPHMRDLFRCHVGLSDHTMGNGVSVASVALGACVIEKHFTLRRADGGVDSAFSLEPEEMKSLVLETERAKQAMGVVSYGPIGEEVKSLQFRRSLYIAEDVKAGERLTPKNLRAVRPGFGLAPKFYDTLLGRPVKKDAKKGTAVTWDLV
ncbi:MAG: pseudaminic acid synthase [Bacteriovoracia bacterium]